MQMGLKVPGKRSQGFIVVLKYNICLKVSAKVLDEDTPFPQIF